MAEAVCMQQEQSEAVMKVSPLALCDGQSEYHKRGVTCPWQSDMRNTCRLYELSVSIHVPYYA